MGVGHFILFILAAFVIVFGCSYGGIRFYNYIKLRGVSRGEKVLLYIAFLIVVIVLLNRK